MFGCGEPESADVQVSSREALQWKRNAALENDLAAALSLQPDELCNELGQGSCTREIHHIALGGSDPLEVSLYEPLPKPLATTPVVVDRVVLSACARRYDLDAEGDAVIFGDIVGLSEAPRPGTPANSDLLVALYHRFLSRDPTEAELESFDALFDTSDGQPPPTPREFAIGSCFAIGTTTEFLFF